MTHREKLVQMLTKSTSDLERAVLTDVLDEEEPTTYLTDLLTHGAQSGAVPALIYYADTRRFYAEHADEIDELRQEMEENTGEPLRIGYPTYNWLAWYGYEETARKIAEAIGIEL